MSHSSGSDKRWEPPSIEELSAQLPQYQIEALMGRGGMGAVYKGRQTSLDRPVAIKILSNQLDEADASFAERFKNEARALGKLSHPGIVGVYEFGEAQGGLLYIVMEFIDGTDVAKMIAKQGRLHTEHAMAITAHVCDALAYAHERGIIHRDIKPANIMVGYDGVVKVADFGLAKMTQSQNSGLTQSGMAMGTLHYMAPEALTLGSTVDQRADIYAVGVMIYQMLTGKLPQGMFEMPSLQVPGLDPRYDKIVSTAMRDDRELRYASAGALRLELDAILTQPVVRVEASAKEAPPALNTQARPKRPEWQPRQPIKLPPARQMKRSRLYTSILVATLCVAAGWMYWQQSGYRFVVEPTQVQPQGINKRATAASGVSPIVSQSSIASATQDDPFVNTLGMRFVPVPIMGGATSGQRVLFSIWETRVRDFEAFVKESGYQWSKITDVEQGIDHAVAGVSRDDAQAFCQWLTQKERFSGRLGSGESYRLPSDHEWSCAVGVGDQEDSTKLPSDKSRKVENLFPWGSQLPPPAGSGNYWSEELRPLLAAGKFSGYMTTDLPGYLDGQATVGQVGKFQANRWGLYDLGGNLWEYCEDWHDALHKYCVLRGGSWREGGLALQSTSRGTTMPDARVNRHGFRCVLSADLESPPPSQVTAASVAVPIVSRFSIESATRGAPFVNTLGMRFVSVPQTKVLFCIHETRYMDYAAYAAENPGIENTWWIHQERDGHFIVERNGDHPVTWVNWEDVQKFCSWLSKKEGKIYRLPTDSEWSTAVGIGHLENWEAKTTPSSVFKDQKEFPWGTYWPPTNGSGNYSDGSRKAKAPSAKALYLEGYDDSFPTTAPVMSFRPNKLGLYDLDGNVREWVQEFYDESKKYRCLRGGCWTASDREGILSSRRTLVRPETRFPDVGFRLVLASLELPMPPPVPGENNVVAAPTATAPLPKSTVEQASAMKPTSTVKASLPKGPTTWTDIQGRSLVATFKAIQGDSVLLEIDGKTQPVALAKLSAASQKLARDFQARAVLPAAPKTQDGTTQKVLKTAVTPPEFVRIPGGTFFMGSTSGDATENDARPERVTVSEFYLQATETTKAQWDEVRTWALSNGYMDMAPADGKAPNHPVHSVSWWDAVRWCNARSEKEGLKPVYTVFGEVMRSGAVEPVADWKANGYRLPTEAEWEKAARGGVNGKRFPWGKDTISHTDANFRNDGGEAYATGSTFYHPRYNDGQAPYTSPVASFKANNFGLHDMAGNVWEWCWERYTDSRLPTGEKRVLRGGSWDFYANSCTAANRGHEMPANRVNRHGFRPARSSIP